MKHRYRGSALDIFYTIEDSKMALNENGVLDVDWMKRAKAAEKKLEDMELVTAYAKDIVNAWPTLTMRTLGAMTSKIETLRQALKEAGK